jgi:uncharacterized SAM-binding protein YcdF (DUF218 family)
LLASGPMRFLRRHPILTALLLAVLLVVGVIAASAIGVWRAAHTDEASRVDHADVIVVLGAAQYNGRPSPVFEARLQHALNMFNDGFSEQIVVAGGGQPGDEYTEGQAGRDYLVSAGVPAEAVRAEGVGTTTEESLRDVASYMRGAGLDSAFLVSDPWHNLRVRRIARDLGITAFVSATGASAARSQETRFSGYARETFAYLWYRISGR